MDHSIALASFVMLVLGCKAPMQPTAPPEARSPQPVISPATRITNTERTIIEAPPARSGAMAPALTEFQGKLGLSWFEPSLGAADDPPKRLQWSTFDGESWSTPSTIREGPGFWPNWADVPHVKAGDGALVASYPWRSGEGKYAYDVGLSRSTDGGKTWSAIGSAHNDNTQTEHGFVSWASSKRGLRAFWLDGRQAAQKKPGPMTLRTSIVGDKPGAARVVDDRVCDCCGTAAVATDRGDVVIYRDRSEDEIRDIAVARVEPSGSVTRSVVAADGWKTEGCPVNGPAVGAYNDVIAAAWYTEAGKRPFVGAAFAGADLKFGQAIVISEPNGEVRSIGRVGLLMIDADRAVVSWVETAGESARIMARGVGSNGKTSAPVKIASTSASRRSGFPQIGVVGNHLLTIWTHVGADQATSLRARKIPLSAFTKNAENAPAPAGRVTQEFPSFAPANAAGEPVELAGTGKPRLLHFWATWCTACRREAPELKAMIARYNDTIRIVGVSVDDDAQRQDVDAFVTKNMLTWEQLYDPQNLSAKLGVTALPETILVDAAGKIVWRFVGPLQPNDQALKGHLDAVRRP